MTRKADSSPPQPEQTKVNKHRKTRLRWRVARAAAAVLAFFLTSAFIGFLWLQHTLQSQLQAAGIQHLTWSVREFSQNTLRLQDVAFQVTIQDSSQYTLPAQAMAVNLNSREISLQYRWQGRPWLSAPLLHEVVVVNPQIHLPVSPFELITSQPSFTASDDHDASAFSELAGNLAAITDVDAWQHWLMNPGSTAPMNHASVKEMLAQLPYVDANWRFQLDHFQLTFPCQAEQTAARTPTFCHFVLNGVLNVVQNSQLQQADTQSFDARVQLQPYTSSNTNSLALVSHGPLLDVKLTTSPEQDFALDMLWQQPQLLSKPLQLRLTPTAIDLDLAFVHELKPWQQKRTPIHQVTKDWHLGHFTTFALFQEPSARANEPSALAKKPTESTASWQQQLTQLPTWLTNTTVDVALTARIPWLNPNAVPELNLVSSLRQQITESTETLIQINWRAPSAITQTNRHNATDGDESSALASLHPHLQPNWQPYLQQQYKLQLRASADDVNSALDLPIQVSSPINIDMLARSESVLWQKSWRSLTEQLVQSPSIQINELITRALDEANLSVALNIHPFEFAAEMMSNASLSSVSEWSMSLAQLWAIAQGQETAMPLQFTQPLQVGVAADKVSLDNETYAEHVEMTAVFDQLTVQTDQLLNSLFHGQLNITSANLEHPALLPQAWQLELDIARPALQSQHQSTQHSQLHSRQQGEQHTSVKGLAETQTGFGVEFESSFDLAALISSQSDLTVDWRLQDIFLIAGNPLTAILRDWPELMTLERGRLQASGQAQLPIRETDNTSIAGNRLQIAATVNLADIVGIYDTAAFRGLNTALQVNLNGDNLSVSTDSLRLLSLQQGFNIGPIEASFDYQAQLEAPTTGLLTLHDNQIHLFDGIVRLANQTYDLNETALVLPVELHAVNLATLLTQYPVSDFNGSGLLSGVVPVRWSERGFSVANGVINALPPGGALRYQSEQFTGFAATNRSMQTLLGILEDFHYDLLSGTVSYDEDGTLELQMSLRGQNPSVEGGRPVHLNVVLQENLPALITSMQLTNQVNQIIEERLQRRLLRQK
ncbi:YdbH domain-containing protein [Aliidiomarina haloalkalitolerans]|uniref:Uncharacterized protein n=1 Tax=Aliidiomarina haloalkalitolerans TaxID=859059 RepID=A0A432VY47_9GAMM|nr:YdbH domain-containing protein [Aliidiomarina haloalkalitolerans]RUO21495.1 hypothetical protein CWE06_01150 [Aliidiomarina haloalkalitolerans]